MTEPGVDHERYRVRPGESASLATRPTDDTQNMDRKTAGRIYENNLKRLDDFQERLYAESRQSLLLVLQGMDTAGKDSTIRKVTANFNPQGCLVSSFRKPTPRELDHDFLWRVHAHAPQRGHIGIFNRSHYEDVLVVRVHGLVPPDDLERRYERINEFERLLADTGTRIIKVMLHVSKKYQLGRLRKRLENPDKYWKFNPGDLAERERWDEYMAAYEIALTRCSTDRAPWYAVPAENRWFRDAVVTQLLVDTLEEMDPRFPPPAFDPADYPPKSLK